MNQKRVLTWHVHGNYLYNLTQAKCRFYLPVKHPRRVPYLGKTDSFNWGKNVIEVPYDQVKDMEFDCILFQSNFNLSKPNANPLEEQKSILSEYQIDTIPKLYLEHDPPRMHPTDTKHPFSESNGTIVHVTHFNDLMWDSGITETKVIEHGVKVPSHIEYEGDLDRGVAVINNLSKRGRRLGYDIFEKVRKEVPIDLIGAGSKQLGGFGEVPPHKLPYVLSRYRFFFSPVRYTSLALSTLEAMTVGLPVVGVASTELSTVIQNGQNGFIHTDINLLIEEMKKLILDKNYAIELGRKSKKSARERFSINRFAKEWEDLIESKVVEKTDRHSKKSSVVHFQVTI